MTTIASIAPKKLGDMLKPQKISSLCTWRYVTALALPSLTPRYFPLTRSNYVDQVTLSCGNIRMGP